MWGTACLQRARYFVPYEQGSQGEIGEYDLSMGNTRLGCMRNGDEIKPPSEAHARYTHYSDGCPVRIVWGWAEEGRHESPQKEV